MNVKEEAIRLHDCGYNCTQCILLACRKQYPEVKEEVLAAVSAGFGGGMRSGEICGAVSGAVMAVGLANPYAVDDSDGKDKMVCLAKECTGSFKEAFGYLHCPDLKREKHSCDELIAYGAQLAEDIINRKGMENKNGNL